ncbi:hypothetical protein HYS93_04370 [Candidatus Daviesbacteria bacterium]|nr:hypothetical protein [Candidatus Daviesbacteria bacterium]
MQATMDTEKIKSEVLQAENELLMALRSGKLIKGVSMHLNSPDYRNIWNGEIKTYDMLETRIKMGMKKGLKSIGYNVQTRDFMFINSDNVLQTLTATETTSMKNGNSETSGLTAISILWQRIDNVWRLGYLHASELPKKN